MYGREFQLFFLADGNGKLFSIKINLNLNTTFYFRFGETWNGKHFCQVLAAVHDPIGKILSVPMIVKKYRESMSIGQEDTDSNNNLTEVQSLSHFTDKISVVCTLCPYWSDFSSFYVLTGSEGKSHQ